MSYSAALSDRSKNKIQRKKPTIKEITQKQPGSTDIKRVAEEAKGGQGTHVPP